MKHLTQEDLYKDFCNDFYGPVIKVDNPHIDKDLVIDSVPIARTRRQIEEADTRLIHKIFANEETKRNRTIRHIKLKENFND